MGTQHFDWLISRGEALKSRATWVFSVVAISERSSNERTLRTHRPELIHFPISFVNKNRQSNVCVVTYPETVAEPCTGGGASSTDVAADSWVMIGCSIQISHWSGAAGAQETSCAWRGGAYETEETSQASTHTHMGLKIFFYSSKRAIVLKAIMQAHRQVHMFSVWACLSHSHTHTSNDCSCCGCRHWSICCEGNGWGKQTHGVIALHLEIALITETKPATPHLLMSTQTSSLTFILFE